MTRAHCFAIGLAYVLSAGAQTEPAATVFEAATIREAPAITAAMAAAGNRHVGVKIDTSQIDIGYIPLSELIRMAYDVHGYQVSGPSWMVDRKWDIVAKLPEGTTRDQIPRMLQVLLAERFGLRAHRETRTHRVYALLAAGGGAKLKAAPASAADDPDAPFQTETSADGKSSTTTGGGRGVTRTQMRPDGGMHLEASSMTMAQLAEALAYYFDLPVLDETRMPGGYEVTLDFTAADLRFAATKAGVHAYGLPASDGAPEPAGRLLIDSVLKFGLRLEKRQEPVEMIVVDALEKAPSAN